MNHRTPLPTKTPGLTATILLASLALCRPTAHAVDLSPAPVPPAVTMARPSAAEIAQATASLQTYKNQVDATTKAIFARYPDLVAIRVPRPNPAVIPFLAPNFRNQHNANTEIAKQGNIDVLFMGDSITDWWRQSGPAGVVNPPRAGKKIFDQYFGSWKVANFGIAGDTTQGVLYRLRDGEGQGIQPKAIMLMIGTNNAGNCSSAEIAEGVGAVVLELRQDFPTAKILLLGIFPRGNPGDPARKTVLDVNPLIAKLHDGRNVFYLDIGDKFLNSAGELTPDIMGDKLHPTEKGYEIWAEAVKGPLGELVK